MRGRQKAGGVNKPRQQQQGPSPSPSDGDFLLQLLRKNDRSASSSDHPPSPPSLPFPLEFVDPAVAALGPSHPLAPTFPHHDHFQPKAFLPHQFLYGPPPASSATESRGYGVERGAANGRPLFAGEALGREFGDVPTGPDWNGGRLLRFGTIGCEVDHQGPVEFGRAHRGHSGSAAERGDGFIDDAVLGETEYGGGFGGHGGAGVANRGLHRKGMTNLGGGGGKGDFKYSNTNSNSRFWTASCEE